LTRVLAEGAEGRNGVVISKPAPRSEGAPGYRNYEVHQRERVGESTEKIKPIQLLSEDYRLNPYQLVEILRENYPCYRDWLANSYWISQYNDVTSIFADDANFETRPRTWACGLSTSGRDLGQELPVLITRATQIDNNAVPIATRLASSLAEKGEGDLATGFTIRFSLELLLSILDIPESDAGRFSGLYLRLQRGTSCDPRLHRDGLRAFDELVTYLQPTIDSRRANPGEDLISTIATLDLDSGPTTAEDLVVTLLEGDHDTIQGALANLWFLLLTHPEEFAKARSEQRLMKLAYLEALRHSTPVITTHRYARHEVERFGRLLPEGAQLVLSAAAANRDPRIFKDPENFIVDRKDLCQREPRGQYRADGLAAGIAFGLGRPSVYPALPEDRPRSSYALTRDTVVAVSQVLLEHLDNLTLAPGTAPRLSALTAGEMHTCWTLPVRFSKKVCS
jgi:cytochrome P450